MKTPVKHLCNFLARPLSLVGAHMWPATREQHYYIVIVVIRHLRILQPPLRILFVLYAEQRIDQERPPAHQMRSVTHHMKSQAEICRPDFIPLVVDNVSHTEKAGFRVLPILQKAFEHGYETGSAQIAGLSALQHETRDH